MSSIDMNQLCAWLFFGFGIAYSQGPFIVHCQILDSEYIGNIGDI